MPRRGKLLPTYSAKRGWHGGHKKTLYAFTDKRTGQTQVRPVEHAGGIGPEVTVRVATRRQAETVNKDYPEQYVGSVRGWQKPLHAGWEVDEE